MVERLLLPLALAWCLAGIGLAQELDPTEWDYWLTEPEASQAGEVARELLRTWVETDPYDPPRPDSWYEQHGRWLSTLDMCRLERCYHQLLARRDDVLAVAPDNPEYWRTLDAVLRYDGLIGPTDFDESRHLVRLGQGLRWKFRVDLVKDGVLDVASVLEVVAALRAWALRVRNTGDLTAMVPAQVRTFEALAVVLHQQRYRGDQVVALDAALSERPVSWRRALAGDARQLYERDPPTDPTIADVRAEFPRTYAALADLSERSWADFWADGIDLYQQGAVSEASAAYLGTTWWEAWGQALTDARWHEGRLAVLRALREVYAGRIAAGVPAQPPLALWQWDWQQAPGEGPGEGSDALWAANYGNAAARLCLVPGDVHPSFEKPPRLCEPFLGHPDD